MKCDSHYCDGQHEGDIKPVWVVGWGRFNYCDKAIRLDTERGFNVFEICPYCQEATNECTCEEAFAGVGSRAD